jgi:hypothetical protein
VKSLFICLANSRKFGERCIAGIQVAKNGAEYQPVEEDGKPKWIRPISKTEHGAVDERFVGGISLLDIVEIEVEEFGQNGYQSENAIFKPASVKKIEKLQISDSGLDSFTDMNQHRLFGNTGKAVSDEVIDSVTNSLTFIKVTDFQVIRKENKQLRMKFGFNNVSYDLPITDTDFERKYDENKTILKDINRLYLTISLGLLHNGWHSKLIAGIVY